MSLLPTSAAYLFLVSIGDIQKCAKDYAQGERHSVRRNISLIIKDLERLQGVLE